MESVSTISKEGVVVGFEDKTANASYVRFFFNGTWAFESESGDAPETKPRKENRVFWVE